LEEACLREGYDSDKYGLKFQNKAVDESLPFRLTGLPNNATLEMIELEEQRSDDSIVQIALQMPDGRREMRDFAISTSLMDVLKRFSESMGSQLTNFPPEELKAPVLCYMNKQVFPSLAKAV